MLVIGLYGLCCVGRGGGSWLYLGKLMQQKLAVRPLRRARNYLAGSCPGSVWLTGNIVLLPSLLLFAPRSLQLTSLRSAQRRGGKYVWKYFHFIEWLQRQSPEELSPPQASVAACLEVRHTPRASLRLVGDDLNTSSTPNTRI